MKVDVSYKVLAKRSLIQFPYSVKPYLSKEEQRCESALLKERWSLIVQSGISRESIKIIMPQGWSDNGGQQVVWEMGQHNKHSNLKKNNKQSLPHAVTA